jgi:hypothetical protein
MPRIILAAAAVAFLLPIPAQAELLVSVSKSQQRLAVTLDGTELYRWPVSTGVRGHDTPAGSFRPHDIERHWYSRQYKLTPMPWAVFFHRGYAVHGTMESYNLGHPASHGCVRLRPDNASILYSLVRRQGLADTKVVVMDGPLPVPPGALPMADAGSPAEDGAIAVAAGEAERNPRTETAYAAKSHQAFAAASAGELEELAAPAKPARANVVVYRVSTGSDERQILRERQAWLRSLDRKYGITR